MKNIARVTVQKTSKKKKLDLEVDVPVFFMKEGEIYVSYSPVLELCSQGKTMQQAEKNFREIIQIFFEEIMEMGTLDQVLDDLGWVKKNKTWECPISVKQIMSVPVSTSVAVS